MPEKRTRGQLSGSTVEEQEADIYVIDADQWIRQGGTAFFDGIDLDAYRRGESVLLVVNVEQDGSASVINMVQEENETGEITDTPVTNKTEITAAAGDELTLSMDVEIPTEPEGMTKETRDFPAVVGEMARYDIKAQDNQNFGLPFGVDCLYSVLISPAYVQRALDTLPPGSYLGPYEAGGPMGFGGVYLFADLNAEYLSTDAALASLATQYAMAMGNSRELFVANLQGYLQTMLTLAGTGVCIGLIAALLLFSTLELEAQRERRRYGILRALGMSRRQQNLALAQQAALQAVTAIVVGSGIYVAFGVRDSILVYQSNEEAVPALLQLLVWQLEDLRYTWFLPLLLLAEFLLVVALYFAAKGRLYKLNLMEMLSQER